MSHDSHSESQSRGEARYSLLQRASESCAGLVLADLSRLGGWILLLALPSFVGVLHPSPNTTLLISMSLLERFIQLVFCFSVTQRWLQHLSGLSLSFSAGSLLRMIVCGGGLWALLILPLIIMTLTDGSVGGQFLAALLLVPAIVLNLRYFFYSLPIALNMSRWREILVVARSFAPKDALLPLCCVIPPLGAQSLVSAGVSALSPDGRLLGVQLALAATSAIFPILSTYLALAVGLEIIGTRISAFRGLDPYLSARLRTIALQAPKISHVPFTLRTGVVTLLVSALVWLGNLLQLAGLPPGPTISIHSIDARPGSLAIEMSLHDPTYTFRGFYLSHLSIAGERGTRLSGPPHSVTLLDGTEISDDNLPRTNTTLRLIATFSIDERRDDYMNLQDVWLWYRRVKVSLLVFSPFEGTQESPSSPPHTATET